ncbi:MAG: membrane-binding protein [Cyclobacteriaceae bacterium]
MKSSIILVLLLITIGCHRPEDRSGNVEVLNMVPDLEWGTEETYYDRMTSTWRFKADSNVVSGYIISYFGNGAIQKKTGLVEGRKEGLQHTYYPNGQLRFSESYADNKLNGKVKRWGLEEGYQLLAELNYKDGKLHGEQKKWYATGELHKLMLIENGVENGMQKAFRKNGALYANYEAKNGRTFGLKRSNLCYELDDEQVVYAP